MEITSPMWFIRWLLQSLWTWELTLKSPMKLSIFSKMKLDLIMTTSLQAYTFGSMWAKALLLMHMKCLIRRTSTIPVGTCAYPSQVVRVIQRPGMGRSVERPWSVEFVRTDTLMETYDSTYLQCRLTSNILFYYWNENIVLDINESHLKSHF